MRGLEPKTPRMEDILHLPVQDPPCAEFSAADIKWVTVEGGRQGGDDIALIQFARVEDFVKGESSNAECPASFRIESRRKRPEGSVSKPRVDGFLEYTLYWCSYGPEDYRESESGVGGSSNNKPATGKGSRPGRRHMMRGCLCHFTVKRLYTRPHLALIIYNQRKHVDKTGAPCHGILDQDALGTKAMYAPRISDELRQKVMSMLYVGIPLDNIIQHHTEVVQGHGGPHNRDDFLTRNDIRNMERSIRISSHESHANDETSVKIWVHRHQKIIFCFHDGGSGPFVLGVQSDWQLQQMLHHGHNGYIALHSTFGSKKLRCPLSTLLVLDSSRTAVPVAWIISSSFVGQDIHEWVVSLAKRIHAKDPGWRPNAFLVDNPSIEISTISDAFQCQVLLCLWRIRRSWTRSILKRCSNHVVQQEMFRHLGQLLYCTRSGSSPDVIDDFMQVFVDQHAFMDYFKRRWLRDIELWVNGVRSFPLATLEFHAAIESYHRSLKTKLFEEKCRDSWSRVDWLIHTLTTEFHSLYWFNQYSVETGYFENLRDKSLSNNAWNQALRIPDIDVTADEQNLMLAKVISQTDRSMAHTIWNPASELSLCDCALSRLGNVCEHVIKVSMLWRTRQVGRPSMIAQAYRQALLNLLQEPPHDPLVLEHAILHVNRLREDIKSLEDVANGGLLQPLRSGIYSQPGDSGPFFPIVE